MAKKEKEVPEEKDEKLPVIDLTKALNALRKNIGSYSLLNSPFKFVNSWINTGSYSLNRIISGDIYHGVPEGRVVVIAGPSGVGKSMIAISLAAHGIRDNGTQTVFYFDSEGGGSIEFFTSMGCDVTKVDHCLVDNIEDTTSKVIKTLKWIELVKKTHPNYKATIIVDSVGNLVPSKVIADAQAGKQVQDQGSRAKLINTMVKSFTIPSLRTDTPVLLLNHIYEGPEMFPSKIKSQSGGKGMEYIASATLQCARKLIKLSDTIAPTDDVDNPVELVKDNDNDDTIETDLKSFYGGSLLRFMCIKNRFIVPYLETEIFLDFSRGLRKYDGLIEPATALGFITKEGKRLKVPSYKGGKAISKYDLIFDDDIWKTFLDEFNEKSKASLAYSTKKYEEELSKLPEKDKNPDEVELEKEAAEGR